MKKISKKTIVLFFTAIILLSLSSCSSNRIEVNVGQNSETYILNEDFQNYLDSFSGFVKTDDGYCFVSDLKLYFYDTEANQAYPVCDKATCDHNNQNCSAFLSPITFFPGLDIEYYDNAVYVYGYETEGTVQHNYMYKISLDNFKKEKAAFLYDSSGGVSVLYMLHRGYVYFTYDGGVMKDTTATIYRTKLGDTSSDAPEKIYEFNGIGAIIHNFSAYGNNIFFKASSYEDEEGNGYKSVLNFMNIHTLESKEIPENEYSYLSDDGKVYYESSDKAVQCLDLKTEEKTLFCNIDGPCYISTDSNYIYFDSRQKMYIDESFTDRKIYVHDKNGKYITEITPKNPNDDCYFGGDDVMIFKENTVVDETVESEGVKGYYVLDKSQLTSSNKQFIDMG